MSILGQLRKMTVVVADTAEIDSIRKHLPQDATTNPSLLFAAAQLPEYQHLIKYAITECPGDASNSKVALQPCLERLAVIFAKEILSIVPGRVSVEVNAKLSFNTQATIQTARRIINLFEKEHIDRSRILIKIASTWEGIRAAEQLEKEGIHCNLTLLFGFIQAVACAEAKVTLISPFVGRIMDWYKIKLNKQDIPATEDPGVISVKQIYNYYKKFGYKTEIMGASFRNTGEIIELAGCDLLTISPVLLEELDKKTGQLERKLDPQQAKSLDLEKISPDEKTFRWMLNEDAMATEKLAEGIRKFNADLVRLEEFIRKNYISK
jgi:transaldolase